jgi:Trypsin-co-occurring domain 2
MSSSTRPKPEIPSGKGYGRIDWSSEPGVQTEPPKAPPAVRVGYLLEEIADEFRALKAAAADDGKEDVLVAEKCTLELGITWTIEGSVDVKFWVLELGAGVSRANAQKVTVEMSLLPGVPLIAGTEQNGSKISTAEAIDWKSDPPVEDREAVTTVDGGALRLAFMLEKLADEFRRAQAAAADKEAILRYDKVTLDLTTTLTANAEAGAKFWIVDVAAKGTREKTDDITVEMKPAGLNEVLDTGVIFLR